MCLPWTKALKQHTTVSSSVFKTAGTREAAIINSSSVMEKFFRIDVIIHLDRAQPEIIALLGHYCYISAT